MKNKMSIKKAATLKGWQLEVYVGSRNFVTV